MALRKAMILFGALLVGTPLGSRIKLDQVSELTLSKTEDMEKHANDRAMTNGMKQMVKQNQEELAETPAEEDVYKEQLGKVEEDVAGEATATLGGADFGRQLPIWEEPTSEATAALGWATQKLRRSAKIPTSPSPPVMEPSNGKETEWQWQREWEAARAEKEEQEQEGKGKNEGKGKDERKDNSSLTTPLKARAKTRGRLLTITPLSYLRGAFRGFIYQEFLPSKTLLIKCWKAQAEFGKEAIIPLASNSVGARVGDKISFDVEDLVRQQNYKGKPSPRAVNVLIHPKGIGRDKLPYSRIGRDTSGLLTIIPVAFLHAEFSGFIYQEIPATKTLLIACWKARDEFVGEAIIPLWGNEVGAKVGDQISFDVDEMVQEFEGKPRPMAINVFIRSRGYGKDVPAEVPALTDACTQILYYLSDESLRTNKFFQDLVATTEGGWISIDILLSCKRINQLAATTESIIECLQHAPGVEVRDTAGQEAVRRTSPHFLQFNGSIAVATAAKQSAVVPAQAKRRYTKEMMKLWGGGMAMDDLGWPLAMITEEDTPAEITGQIREKDLGWPRQGTRKDDAPAQMSLTAKHNAERDARHAEEKAWRRNKAQHGMATNDLGWPLAKKTEEDTPAEISGQIRKKDLGWPRQPTRKDDTPAGRGLMSQTAKHNAERDARHAGDKAWKRNKAQRGMAMSDLGWRRQDQEELAKATGPEANEQEQPAAKRKDLTPAEIKFLEDLAMTKMAGQDQEDLAEGAGPETDEEGRRRVGTGRGVRAGRRLMSQTAKHNAEMDAGHAGWTKAEMDAGHKANGRTKAQQAAKDKRSDWPARAKARVEAKEVAEKVAAERTTGELIELQAAEQVAADRAAAENATGEKVAAEKAVAERRLLRKMALAAQFEAGFAESVAALAGRRQNAKEAQQAAAEKAEEAEAGTHKMQTKKGPTTGSKKPKTQKNYRKH